MMTEESTSLITNVLWADKQRIVFNRPNLFVECPLWAFPIADTRCDTMPTILNSLYFNEGEMPSVEMILPKARHDPVTYFQLLTHLAKLELLRRELI